MPENTKEFEGYLTKEDFKRVKGSEVPSDAELEKINNHPLGEGDRENTLQSEENYSAEDYFDNSKETPVEEDRPGDLYHLKENAERNLLENTPEKDKRYINVDTKVEGRDKRTYRYKAGFTYEEAIATRFLEDGKWPVKNGLHEYVAITKVKFFFTSRNTGEKVHLFFEPGEKFWAPKSGENKEKREEMLKKESSL